MSPLRLTPSGKTLRVKPIWLKHLRAWSIALSTLASSEPTGPGWVIPEWQTHCVLSLWAVRGRFCAACLPWARLCSCCLSPERREHGGCLHRPTCSHTGTPHPWRGLHFLGLFLQWLCAHTHLRSTLCGDNKPKRLRLPYAVHPKEGHLRYSAFPDLPHNTIPLSLVVMGSIY